MSAGLAERLLASLPAAADDNARAARAAFLAAGLPDRKVESWRYSALAGLATLDASAGAVAAMALPDLGGLSGTLVELRGGGYSLSASVPAGVAVAVGAGSSRELLRANAEEVRGTSPLPQKAAQAQAFRWLAVAGVDDVLAIDVRSKVDGVWRLAMQHDALGFAQSCAQVRVRSGAAITLVEHVFGGDDASGLSNRLLDIELEPGASLTLIRVQESGAKAHSIQRTTARIAPDARLELVSLELGGLWSRHELAIDLVGARANAKITGLVALQGRQHHDTQLSLTHAAGAAMSRTLWKAIANGRSRSVFNGLITVAPGADQTEAHLKTSNLLLSPHAEIDTKPELVIEADEVVCSHGATVGQLDDKALFYLRSRGLPEAQARQMLTLAFGGEVLSAVADATLRRALSERVDAHLPT
ncbi:MAG TPA: Fe-S cluster assembly protein SufD [Xanthomonadales bacterium]|nr:Fe-S cluster assembly protein SufD [Xanthomonadales bacterium]